MFAMAVGVSGRCGSGVGDVEESTELGLLKAAWVIESSGVSKKFKSNSEWASNFTSVISSAIDASGSMSPDESMWYTSMVTQILNGTKTYSTICFYSLHSVLINELSINFSFTPSTFGRVHRWADVCICDMFSTWNVSLTLCRVARILSYSIITIRGTSNITSWSLSVDHKITNDIKKLFLDVREFYSFKRSNASGEERITRKTSTIRQIDKLLSLPGGKPHAKLYSDEEKCFEWARVFLFGYSWLPNRKNMLQLVRVCSEQQQ